MRAEDKLAYDELYVACRDVLAFCSDYEIHNELFHYRSPYLNLCEVRNIAANVRASLKLSEEYLAEAETKRGVLRKQAEESRAWGMRNKRSRSATSLIGDIRMSALRDKRPRVGRTLYERFTEPIEDDGRTSFTTPVKTGARVQEPLVCPPAPYKERYGSEEEEEKEEELVTISLPLSNFSFKK